MKPLVKKSQAYKDETSRHMDEACKYKELHSKLKSKIKLRKELDPKYECSEATCQTMDDAKLRHEHHSEQYSGVNKKLQEALKKETEKKAKEKMKKGKLAIAMQDHEKHEQYQADKLKYGTTTSDLAEKANCETTNSCELETKGGPGSGPKPGFKETIKEGYLQAKTSADTWEARAKADSSDERAQKMAKLFKQKLEAYAKENMKYLKVTKSLMQLDAGTGTAVNTADYSISEEASQDWLEDFRELMVDYSYGDVPRSIELSRGHSINISKVDDGLYSGYVSRINEDETEENVGKVSMQSLADIIQYCKAREYIMPEELEASDMGSEAPSYDGSAVSMNEAPEHSSKHLEFMKLLDRLLDRI